MTKHVSANDLNVIWLGFTISDEQAKALFLMDPTPAIQTHKFGWSFVRSLQQVFSEVVLASTYPIQSYPLVDQLIFRHRHFHINGMNGVLLGFINVVILKHIIRFFACLISVTPIIQRKQIQWIFVHGVHAPFLYFAWLSRAMGCKVVVVLTDPPGVILPTDGVFTRLLKKFDALQIGFILRRIDAVISLAPDLAQMLAPGKPALIFPGILESTLSFPVSPLLPKNIQTPSNYSFTIMYAGGLNKVYGIDRLIDAILSFDESVSICLKLYGRGDQVERIKELSSSNARIFYGGFVEAKILSHELCSSDLLINPRPTVDLYNKLSFPSKLIEYLATGLPVLTTRISTIPTEMREYFYFIDDESVEGIRLAIARLMNTPLRERVRNGQAGREFVQTHLSEAATGNNIAMFIKKLT